MRTIWDESGAGAAHSARHGGLWWAQLHLPGTDGPRGRRFPAILAAADPGAIVAMDVATPAARAIAIVAAARSRCPVLPLSPDAPQARRQTMLDDARPAVLLRETGDDTLTAEPLAPRPRPDTASSPAYDMRDVAYIMYTSGSTGRQRASSCRTMRC